VTYIAVMELIFAGFVFWIDEKAGMPRAWALVEAPAIIFFSGLILILRLRSPRAGG
jgi:hypothetical protein